MNIAATNSLKRGIAAHKAGKLDEADLYYRAVIESLPASPDNDHDVSVLAEAYCNLGAGQQQRGDLNAAIEGYRQAVQTKPSYVEVYYILGQALRDKGELNASIDSYEQAVNIRPNNIDALNQLGTALQYNGSLDAAIDCYKQALSINPRFAEAYNNMGSSYHAKGDIDKAIDSYKRALETNPSYPNAHNNMGHALHDKGDLRASIESYNSALKIDPDCSQTHNNLGNALREVGEYEKAIEHFDFIAAIESNPANPEFWFGAQSQIIECLYILGRYAELRQRLNTFSESSDINLRVAAVSTFISNQLKFDDPYPFCKTPLDFFHTSNLDKHIPNVNEFVEDLILDASKVPAVWEPQHGVTKSGFQTAPTIFFEAGENIGILEKILRKEIASYHSKFKSENCEFMNLWPSEYDLRGWFCRLVKNGHQQTHNHPAGWLSGVIYLKTLDSSDSDEGAIELSLHGHGLPILDKDYARKIHRPVKGDIVFFPSSLFHKTIPFSEDTERCVIAFDLYRYSH
jgi:tetratricopeptide (TPR) repeat protein